MASWRVVKTIVLTATREVPTCLLHLALVLAIDKIQHLSSEMFERRPFYLSAVFELAITGCLINSCCFDILIDGFFFFFVS